MLAGALALVALAYLLGSVPFSLLVARANGVDLRQVGSGNIGAANVWRSCGFGAFVLAASCDILKGYLPTFAALWYGLSAPMVVLVGMAAILGHTFSLFLRFRGGKAVATSGGVCLAIAPVLMLIGALAWVVAFAISRISAVGSLAAVAAVALAAAVVYATGGLALVYTLFVWVACALIVYLHRANIRRLLAGSELRIENVELRIENDGDQKPRKQDSG